MSETKENIKNQVDNVTIKKKSEKNSRYPVIQKSKCLHRPSYSNFQNKLKNQSQLKKKQSKEKIDNR